MYEEKLREVFKKNFRKWHHLYNSDWRGYKKKKHLSQKDIMYPSKTKTINLVKYN